MHRHVISAAMLCRGGVGWLLFRNAKDIPEI